MPAIKDLPVGARVCLYDHCRQDYDLHCFETWRDVDGVNHREELWYRSKGVVVGAMVSSRVPVVFRDITRKYDIICDVLLAHISPGYTKQPMAPMEGCRVFKRQDNELGFDSLEFGRIISVMQNNETDDPETSVIIASCDGMKRREAKIGKDVVVVY